MTRIKDQFTERPTRFVGIDERQGWWLKCYEITIDGEETSREIRAAADAAIGRHLVGTAVNGSVGFVVMHAGQDAIWLLINLWNGELLHQVTLSASLDTPDVFAPVGVDGPSACVWELRVIAHEREAYVRHVLASTGPVRVKTYLSDSVEIRITSECVIGRCDHRATIKAFNARWNAGDVDGLMDLLTKNPVYRASTGPEPGEVHHGQANVRAAFERIMSSESTLGPPPPVEQVVFIEGDRGVSSWSYRGQDSDDNTCLIEGVDLWVFEQGRIALKDAYRKAFPDVPKGSVTQGESS